MLTRYPQEYVSSPQDILQLVKRGERVRSVTATDMNELSSRSHTVLTITVTEKLFDASIRVGKLNLADLAGSERADKSGLMGQTLEEAKVCLGHSSDGSLIRCRKSTSLSQHWATASMP